MARLRWVLMISDIRLFLSFPDVSSCNDCGPSPCAGLFSGSNYYSRSVARQSPQPQLVQSPLSFDLSREDRLSCFLRSHSGTCCVCAVGPLFTPIRYTPSTRDNSR